MYNFMKIAARLLDLLKLLNLKRIRTENSYQDVTHLSIKE